MQTLANWLGLPPSRPRISPEFQLTSPRLALRLGENGDWRTWRVLRDSSRDYLTPWEPQWPPNALSYNFYCGLVRRQWREWRQGQAFAFSIFLRSAEYNPLLVGGITLGDVQYGAAQKGTIGYWVGRSFAKQGIMTEAVGLVCNFAFEQLRLHRVEASCMPANFASQTVLIRNGFAQEGFAKAYLQINGVREDHLLWGKANPSQE